MNVDYEDLGRTFSEASEKGEDSDRDLLRYLRRRDQKPQGWQWLMESRIVVILNEAGAGKTEEIAAEVRRQQEAGKAAFLFPIERLCAHSVDDAFPSEADRTAFARWQRSRKPATFFLDSVDEAKLPKDLDKNPLNAAIRRIEAAIGRRFRRVRFVISSRPSAWTPELELAEVHRLAARYEGLSITGGDNGAPLARFVRLDALDGEQIAKLASKAGANDTFIADLRAAGAEGMASTPLDTLDFVESHTDALAMGKPGADAFRNLALIVDRSIERRALDLDSPNPRSKLPLSRVRAGARRLACACVMGQQLSIRLPGSRAAGIDPLMALSSDNADWSLFEIQQLLGGGLFTAAWQGAVRFHHRRTMEHLAAEAFDELLRSGMAVNSLAEILTPTAFGVASVPRHFQETVGWLATLNPAFCHHILLVAPQVLLDLGDPGSHATAVRERALRGHVARFVEIRYLGEWFPDDMLRRFAAPQLEPPCRELLATALPDEPKTHLLDLVQAGRFHGCVPEILSIASDPGASPPLRTRAVEVLAELGTASDLRAVARTLFRYRRPAGPSEAYDRYSRNRLRAAVVMNCFPAALSLSEAVGILAGLEEPDRSYMFSIEHQLASRLVNACEVDQLERLLRWLRRLCWEPTVYELGGWSPPKWSRRGRVLLPCLEEACVRSLLELPQSHDDERLALDVDKLFNVRKVAGGPLDRYDAPNRLGEAIATAPKFRRTVFIRAAREANKKTLDPIYTVERLCHFTSPEIALACARDDLGWLEQLYPSSPDVAGHDAVIEGLNRALRALPSSERAQERRRLLALSRSWGKPGAFKTPLWRPDRQIRFMVRRWWWDQRLLKSRSARKSLVKRLRQKIDLRLNLKGIRDGRDFRRIYLAFGRYGEAGKSIRAARERLGDRLGDALQEGSKAFAIRHVSDPAGPQTAGDQLASIGWNQIAADEPDRLNGISENEAQSLLAATLKDTAFPQWAGEVAARHPEVWGRVVSPRVASELAAHNYGGSHRFSPWLSLASRQSDELLRPLAAETLRAMERSTTPSFHDVLDAGRVIRSQPSLHPQFLSLVVRRSRAFLYAGETDEAAPWIGQWLALDPSMAWAAVREFRDGIVRRGDDILVQKLFSAMSGCFDLEVVPAEVLAQMSADFQRHLRVEEDDERSGYVTPRQRAQDLRSAAPTILSQRTSEEDRRHLEGLKSVPAFARYGDWLSRLLRDQARAAAVKPAWRESQVADFLASWLKRPESADELQALVQRHLTAIISDLHTSDFDRRGLFKGAVERDVRAFLGHALQAHSRDWYSVTQETVTAGEKRTDLRIEAKTAASDVVVVELKVAGKSWTVSKLIEHMESQLVAQYLISKQVRRGVYGIVDLHAQKNWTHQGAKLTFSEVCERLQAEADRLNRLYPDIDSLVVLPLSPMKPRP